MMMDIVYTLIFLIAGALGGLFRTYISHEARLIWPMIDPKKQRMRFGFLVSVAMGAFVAYLATIGIVAFLPLTEQPDSIYSCFSIGFIVGLGSQTILEKLVGVKLRDPDALVLGGKLFAPFEMNLPKQKMYEYVADNIPEVERLLITDGDVAGVMKVIVVPKNGENAQKVKMKVENTFNQMKCPGIQVYVTLPHEKVIDLKLTVEVMDGHDPEKTRETHIPKIKEVITNYINSIPPGEVVMKSKIITKIVSSNTLIRDVRGDRIISSIPFDSGRIPIGRFEVARAGKINVELIIRAFGEEL